MKKSLLAAATLVVLLTTGAMAQRNSYPNGYPQQPGYNQPGYGAPNYNYDYDDYRFDRHLDWWDRELNLSRRQEREIRRIRDRFQQQTQNLNPRDPRQRDLLRQTRQREFFDMMAVLNSNQRDRVIERMRPYERVAGRGYPARPNRNNGGYGPYGY